MPKKLSQMKNAICLIKDVEMLNFNGRLCRILDKELSKWEHDSIGLRWHFLDEYLDKQEVRVTLPPKVDPDIELVFGL